MLHAIIEIIVVLCVVTGIPVILCVITGIPVILCVVTGISLVLQVIIGIPLDLCVVNELPVVLCVITGVPLILALQLSERMSLLGENLERLRSRLQSPVVLRGQTSRIQEQLQESQLMLAELGKMGQGLGKIEVQACELLASAKPTGDSAICVGGCPHQPPVPFSRGFQYYGLHAPN